MWRAGKYDRPDSKEASCTEIDEAKVATILQAGAFQRCGELRAQDNRFDPPPPNTMRPAPQPPAE